MVRYPHAFKHADAEPQGGVRWDYTDRLPGCDRAREGALRSADPRSRHPVAGGEHVLLDVLFSTPKELRHQAEQLFGELFVPTEVLLETPHRICLELRVPDLGGLRVHGERERRWQPFRIVRVERNGAGRAAC